MLLTLFASFEVKESAETVDFASCCSFSVRKADWLSDLDVFESEEVVCWNGVTERGETGQLFSSRSILLKSFVLLWLPMMSEWQVLL